MFDRNLAPWIRLPDPQRPTLSDYSGLPLFAFAGTPIERSLDCPIVEAVIDSLRFELENAHEMVKCLQRELLKARGDDDE